MGRSASSEERDRFLSEMKGSLERIRREFEAIAGRYPSRSLAERIRCVSEMVDKMLGALRSRNDAEPHPAQAKLEELQARLRGLASPATPAMAESLQRELYSLQWTYPTLDKLHWRISYSQTIQSVSRNLRSLEELSGERELSENEMLQMQRLRRFLAALEEQLRKSQED